MTGTEILTSETGSLQQQKPCLEDTFSEDKLSTAGASGVLFLRLGAWGLGDLCTTSTAWFHSVNAIAWQERWPHLTGVQTQIQRRAQFPIFFTQVDI